MSEITNVADIDAASTASLADLEVVIERGLQTFVEVGLALLAVRDRRLYLDAGYADFTTYVQQRWGFSDRHARRAIIAAQWAPRITEAMEEQTGQNVRPAAAHIEATLPVAKAEGPEAAAQVLAEVHAEAEEAGTKVTAKAIREKAALRSGGAAQPAARSETTCSPAEKDAMPSTLIDAQAIDREKDRVTAEAVSRILDGLRTLRDVWPDPRRLGALLVNRSDERVIQDVEEACDFLNDLCGGVFAERERRRTAGKVYKVRPAGFRGEIIDVAASR